MNASGVRAFPWSSLDATTLAEVRALRDAKRWAAGRLRVDAIRQALSRLVEAEIDLRLGRVRRLGAYPGDGWVGVTVRGADDTGPGAILEVEPGLAAHVAARVLKRPTPLVGASPPGPGIAGTLAAVLLAALRQAHAGVAMRVLGAGPIAVLEVEMQSPGADPWAISLTVIMGHEAFAARLIVPLRAGPAIAEPPWDARTLRALSHTPLSIPIVACAVRLTGAELAALRPGDAFVPDPGRAWWPPRGSARSEEARGTPDAPRQEHPPHQRHQPHQPVWLSAPGSDVGVRAQLAEGSRLVLTGELDSMLDARIRETPMDHDANAAMVSVLGDLPVVVRVEIGEATMSARDWASLGRGDVIALGRRVGDLVVLRVGGLPVARGELVELEGEVAVRIAERLVDEGASP